MEDLEKIKRHLAKSIPITLKNQDGVEDVFYLKPLNVEQQAIMIGLSRKFQKKDGKEIQSIEKEDFKEMANLVKNIVNYSLGLEDPILEEFVTSNFDVLTEKITSDLLPKIEDSKIEKIKKRIKESKDEGTKSVTKP